MDLKRIVDTYESTIADRAAAEKELKDAQAQSEATLFALHTAKMQKVMKETITPVLEDAIRQLSDAGYPCSIHEVKSKDQRLNLHQIVIQIVLAFHGKTLQGPMSLPGQYTLEYVGDIQKFVINAIESLNGGPMMLQDGYNMPLSEITTATIERQVELFVEHAMKKEARSGAV